MGEQDRLLTAEEVAAIIGVKARWVSVNQRKLPFRVAISQRVIRYSAKGLKQWLDSRPTTE